jgi:hypothetical protein
VAALFVAMVLAVLLVPAGVNAVTPLFNVLITDPEDQTQRARVDATGALKVSTTGTVTGSVSVTNTPLPVTGEVNVGNFPQVQQVSGTVNVANFPGNQPATKQFGDQISIDAPYTRVLHEPIAASLVVVNGADDELTLTFELNNEPVLRLYGRDEATGGASSYVIPLTQPIVMDAFSALCANEFDPCQFTVSIVGA